MKKLLTQFRQNNLSRINSKGENMNGFRKIVSVLIVPFLFLMVPYAAIGKSKDTSKEDKSPLSTNIGGAQIRIGGFLDGIFVYRSTDTGTGIASAFNTLPFNNTIQGNMPENRLSAQNSQFTLSVKDQIDNADLKAYMETDFLGNAPANLFVTSNSDTLRLRQYWLDLTRGQVEFTVGQCYSLLTPNRFGLSPENADVFGTKNIDPTKQVGLSWTRAMQFRVVYHPEHDLAIGLALENPDQYVGAGEVIYPFAYNASLGPQFDAANQTTIPNAMPDIIAKASLDFDNNHFEAGAFFRAFQVAWIQPGYSFGPPYGAGIPVQSATGFGGEFSALLELEKGFRLVGTSFIGSGGGRYLDGLGPDVVMKVDNAPIPNLYISPVFGYGGITGFELQATPDTQFAGYFGFVQFEANAFQDYTSPLPTKPYIGFGGPNSPNSANRYIREFSVDFLQNIWKSEGHGALQWGAQFSYVDREPWFVPAGAPADASVNMLYTDIKYILP